MVIERVWVFFQAAALVLSVGALLGGGRYVYGGGYFAVVVALGISVYQGAVQGGRAKGASGANGANGAGQGANGANGASDIPPREPLTDLSSWVAEAYRLWAIARPQLRPLLANASTPYLVLAIFQWLVLKRVSLTLVPFAIFAFFHLLAHVKTAVVPRAPLSTPTKENIKQGLETLSARLGQPALVATVYIELACFALYVGNLLSWLLLKLVGRGSGFVANVLGVAVWFLFLNVRYNESIVVKGVVARVVAVADALAADPRAPPQLAHAWARAKTTSALIFNRVKVALQ